MLAFNVERRNGQPNTDSHGPFMGWATKRSTRKKGKPFYIFPEVFISTVTKVAEVPINLGFLLLHERATQERVFLER